MPLSENEQKMLEQMERALYAEDPRFASHMKGGRMSSASKQRVTVGVCVAVIGLALVVAGVAVELIALGVVGFVVMVAGVAWAAAPTRGGSLAAVRNDGGATKPRSARRGKGAKNVDSGESFTSRMEERWEKRRREGQGW